MQFIDGIWPPTVSADTVKELAQQAKRTSGIVLTGPQGSGRHMLANEIAACNAPGASIRTVHPAAATPDSVPLLRDLGAPDGAGVGTSVDHAAQLLGHALGGEVATLICGNVDELDPFTLRVLTSAARQRQTVIILLSSHPPSSWNDASLPVFEMPALTSAVVAKTIETRLGARPIPQDLRWLTALCAGDYTALRWIVDICLHNNGVDVYKDSARFTLPRPDAVAADRELEPRIASSELGRILALVPDAPTSLVRRLVGSLALADAADQGLVRMNPDLGTVQLRNGAVGYDVLLRASFERLRLTLEQIIDEIQPDDGGPGWGGASLMWHCARAKITVPSRITAQGIPPLIAAGDSFAPGAPELDHPERQPDLVLADVWAGRIDEAVERAQRIDNGADATLTAGLALVVAEIRFGPLPAIVAGIDALIERLRRGDHAAESEVLIRYRSLLRKDAPRARWDHIDDHAAPLTATRLATAQAVRDLFNGRPQRALSHWDEVPPLDDPEHPVDSHMRTVIRFIALLTIPDLDRTRASIPVSAPIVESNASLDRLLAAILALCEGDVTAAYHQLRTEREVLVPLFPTAEGLIECGLAFCAYLLGESADGDYHLQRAEQFRTDSQIFSLIHRFSVAGVLRATTSKKASSDSASEMLETVAHDAREADIIVLPLLCALGSLMQQERDEQRLELARVTADRERTENAFDGVFEIYSRLAQAMFNHDRLAAASITLQLHNQGLLLEAIGASRRLPSKSPVSAIPQSLERAVARIARWRPENAARSISERILTRRENEVALLLRRGLTDREIADRLHLSVRTVSVHVSRILRKLSVRTRHEVDDVLRELDGER